MHDILARARDGRLGPFQILSEKERGLVSALAKQKLLWVDAAGNIRLEPAGYAALAAKEEEFQRQRQQRAYEDAARSAERAYFDQQTQKQFRHDWRIAVFELIGGFILGAVADHFFDIVGYAAGLWRSLFH